VADIVKKLRRQGSFNMCKNCSYTESLKKKLHCTLSFLSDSKTACWFIQDFPIISIDGGYKNTIEWRLQE